MAPYVATGPQLERIARLEVAAELVACEYMIGPAECLVVRWDHKGPWGPLHATVQGFSFEPGHTYILDVALFSWRGRRNLDQDADIRGDGPPRTGESASFPGGTSARGGHESP